MVLTQTFEDYPLFALVTIGAIETIFIAIFVLISTGRQTAQADKRAERDYEVNVLTCHELTEIRAMIRNLMGI